MRIAPRLRQETACPSGAGKPMEQKVPKEFALSCPGRRIEIYHRTGGLERKGAISLRGRKVYGHL